MRIAFLGHPWLCLWHGLRACRDFQGALQFSRCPTSRVEPGGPQWKEGSRAWITSDELMDWVLGESVLPLVSLKLPRIWSILSTVPTYSMSERAAQYVGMAPSEQLSWFSFGWDPSCAGAGRRGKKEGEESLMFVLHNSDNSQYLHEMLFTDWVFIY